MSEQKNYNDMSDSEKKKEDWMNNKWRPMMGWMYMAVCMADFVLFPVLWSIVQVHGGGEVKAQWMPITLQGAGLFHMAMGAILGIAAFGRTQEKLAGANNGGITPASTPSFSASTPSFGSAPLGGNTASTVPSGFSQPRPAASNSFSAPAVTATPGMPAMSKPVSTGPIDSDYMPPRE